MAPAMSMGNAALKTVLVTGVSQGLGRAMAVELGWRGHLVIGIARSEEKLSSLREECPRPNGQQHLFNVVDVLSDAGLKELARQVVEAGLVPDIVVNNAAIVNKNNTIWEVPAEEIDLVIDVNIKGTINVLRHFMPILIRRGHGVVVNMSSTVGRTAAPSVVPYCTTKWAVEGLSRSMAMEVPGGLAVITLDPGVIYTDMLVSCIGAKAAEFPTPQAWAPSAVDLILNFTVNDNGASETVIMNKEAKQTWGSIVEDFTATGKL